MKINLTPNKLRATVIELKKYRRGEYIPEADKCIFIDLLPIKTQKCLSAASRVVEASRKAIKHIMEKERIGEFLIRQAPSIIRGHSEIYLSDQGHVEKRPRYILVKRHEGKASGRPRLYNLAVIIEIETRGKKNQLVSAMTADMKYIEKRFKKVECSH